MWPAICCMRRICRSFSVSAYLTTRLEDAPWKNKWSEWSQVESRVVSKLHVYRRLFRFSALLFFPFLSAIFHHLWGTGNPITGHYFAMTALGTCVKHLLPLFDCSLLSYYNYIQKIYIKIIGIRALQFAFLFKAAYGLPQPAFPSIVVCHWFWYINKFNKELLL